MIEDTPYGIGSDLWPGLSKLVEELGEVAQVVGKIMGTGGDIVHWSGPNLDQRLSEELGDLLASISFVIEENKQYLNEDEIYKRAQFKRAKFDKWHANPKNPKGKK